jgi:hypothetical protein
MTITNIIDRRKRPYRFRKINAVIEPTRHDNACKDADHAGGTDISIGYSEREGISLSAAVEWASAAWDDEVTLYIYDEDGGLYPSDEALRINEETGK